MINIEITKTQGSVGFRVELNAFTSSIIGENRNLITVEGRTILDTPNDSELGAKVRQMYWDSKKQLWQQKKRKVNFTLEMVHI